MSSKLVLHVKCLETCIIYMLMSLAAVFFKLHFILKSLCDLLMRLEVSAAASVMLHEPYCDLTSCKKKEQIDRYVSRMS